MKHLHSQEVNIFFWFSTAKIFAVYGHKDIIWILSLLNSEITLIKSDSCDLLVLHCYTFLKRKKNPQKGFPKASHQKIPSLSGKHPSSRACWWVGLVTLQPQFWCHSCQAEGSTEGRHLCGNRKTIRSKTPGQHNTTACDNRVGCTPSLSVPEELLLISVRPHEQHWGKQRPWIPAS